MNNIITKKTVEKTKISRDENHLIKRLVDGIGGWLSFRQASNGRKLYSEYLIYPPLYEIALGNSWRVLPQEAIIASKPKQGAPKTLDFVFYKKRKRTIQDYLVMLEVKFFKNANNLKGKLSLIEDDFEKLNAARKDRLFHCKLLAGCGEPKKWQLLIAPYGVLDRLCRQRDGRVSEILQAALSQGEQKGLIYISNIETWRKKEAHWHILALEQRNWLKG